MRPTTFLTVPLLWSALVADAGGQAQESGPALETRVWLDRGEEPILQRGDQVRVYYRASEDAWAAIFRIDTDGVISMVFPQHPGAIEPVRGGRDFRLLFPDTPAWRVGDDPGVGYFFMIASPEPLDFSAFPFDPQTGWDLGAVGGVVYEDPYVAIDDYVALLVPDWEVVPYALDFLTYHVGNTYSYPRFLCYDCHTPRAYTAWNPYSAVCSSFRVVIWDDPYFYPSYRYSGMSVVVARPARALPRYEVVTRAAGDIGVRPLVRARAAPERRVAEFKEAPTVDPATRVPVRRAAPSAQQARPSGGAGRAIQEDPRGAAGRPTLQRRPSGTLPGRTPPRATAPRAQQERTGGERPDVRRPDPGQAGSAARDAPTRPSQTRPGTRPSAGSSTPTRSGAGRPVAPREPDDRPTAPGRTTPRATSPAPGRSTPRATSPAPSRPSSARPAPSRPSTRPATPSSSRPSARPAPAPRQPAPRPTVQPRGRTRGN